jgi:hypothetical protein
MIECIMLSEEEDIPRFVDVIKEEIGKGAVKEFPKFKKSASKKRSKKKLTEEGEYEDEGLFYPSISIVDASTIHFSWLHKKKTKKPTIKSM